MSQESEEQRAASEARAAELAEELAITDLRRAEEEEAKAEDAIAEAQREESKKERKRREAEERRKAAAQEAEKARAAAAAEADEARSRADTLSGPVSGAAVASPGRGADPQGGRRGRRARRHVRRRRRHRAGQARAVRRRRVRRGVPVRPDPQEDRRVAMPEQPSSEMARAIQDVTERAQLLVREEVALAKAEMTEKVTKLIKGAVFGIIAGVFAVFALIYLLHALSWGLWDLIGSGDDYWLGFLITGVLILIVGLIAGFIAVRLIKRGSPPAPQMAIEEGKLIKATLTADSAATPKGPVGARQAPEEVPS